MPTQTATSSPQPRNGKSVDTFLDPDLELLHRFGNTGDPAAFAQIVQRYVSVVYATALRIVGDSARAEDVSQETFFRLMRRPHEIHLNLGAWLHRTATHLALDAIRSDGARRKREINYSQDCHQREASTWSELSPCVDQAISELPEELRVLLVRHFLLGKTQAQLAVEMRQSPATISRRMQQGLEELRRRLRLKGVYALPAALAGLLCHVAARQAPATLLHELGKMTLFTGAASAAKAASIHAARARVFRLTGSDRVLAKFLNPNVVMAFVGMAGAALILQFLTGAWTIHWNSPVRPAETPPHIQRDQPTLVAMEGLDGSRAWKSAQGTSLAGQ
jgi:RNA polymerase sigma-70 factor (ECF subfamily)